MKGKGVAERSSVFASEIFTEINLVSEEPPEVIYIPKRNACMKCLEKNWLYSVVKIKTKI